MKEQLKARVAELSKQIAEATAERGKLNQQLAELSTRFKVGDRITYEGANCVWQINGIAHSGGKDPYFFGAKIRKDGTPGALSNRFDWRKPWGTPWIKVEA